MPGALGIRLRIKSTAETLTFVTAHLAPHDHNVTRRNQDWRSIVSRMTFRSKGSQQPYQIYDTDYLYVFGDLNYRTSKVDPVALQEGKFASMLEDKRYPDALVHDQLSIEQDAGRTLHDLDEGKIDFAPSYKYKKRTNDLVVRTIDGKGQCCSS